MKAKKKKSLNEINIASSSVSILLLIQPSQTSQVWTANIKHKHFNKLPIFIM